MIQLNQGHTIGQKDSIKHPVFSDIGFFCRYCRNRLELDTAWSRILTMMGIRIYYSPMAFPKILLTMILLLFRKMASKLVTKKDMLDEIPEVKIHNYIFKNNGGSEVYR